MRKKSSSLHVQAVASCILLVAGAVVCRAEGAPGTVAARSPIPDMACRPVPARQGALPPAQWNDCVGAYTFQNGNSYRGEFHHGKRSGYGVLAIEAIGSSDEQDIEWNEPAVYIGSFRHGRLNGHGLLIGQSGAAYAGTFKDNVAQPDLTRKECRGDSSAWTDCIGTYRFPGGNVYRGEFANGLPDGIGMLRVKAIGSSDARQVRLPLPGIYVGRFKDGRLNGRGAVVMHDGGFFGTFRDNTLEPGERSARKDRQSRGGHAGRVAMSDRPE